MKSKLFLGSIILSSFAIAQTKQQRLQIANEMEHSIQTELLNKQYPQCVDSVYGGFISTYTYDFKPTGAQDKFIVTQARHTWTTANGSELYPNVSYFIQCSENGFHFLRGVMWDKTYGGFYDEGYYFKSSSKISIIKDSKNWWAQAEGLNTLLLMADLFPNDKMHYFDHFKKEWSYTQNYIIDHVYGEWYEEELDKEPERKNCIERPYLESSLSPVEGFIQLYKKIADR